MELNCYKIAAERCGLTQTEPRHRERQRERESVEAEQEITGGREREEYSFQLHCLTWVLGCNFLMDTLFMK